MRTIRSNFEYGGKKYYCTMEYVGFSWAVPSVYRIRKWWFPKRVFQGRGEASVTAESATREWHLGKVQRCIEEFLNREDSWNE